MDWLTANVLNVQQYTVTASSSTDTAVQVHCISGMFGAAVTLSSVGTGYLLAPLPTCNQCQASLSVPAPLTVLRKTFNTWSLQCPAGYFNNASNSGVLARCNADLASQPFGLDSTAYTPSCLPCPPGSYCPGWCRRCLGRCWWLVM